MPQAMRPRLQFPHVLILPHAGWDYSGETAWSAVRQVRDSKFRRASTSATGTLWGRAPITLGGRRAKP